MAVALAALSLAPTAQAQVPATSQPAGSPAPALSPSADLQSALSQVQNTLTVVEVRRWKASRGIRRQTRDNVVSIQQDMSQTLPGLLAAADAAPESVPQSFAVYRNVDALYDVLLRVSAVADFSAPRDDAEAIAGALQQLETARSRLGDAILRVSQHQELQIGEFRSAIQAARAAAAAPPKQIVIDDGPVRSSRKRRERKVIHHKREEKHAAGTPKSGSK